MSHQATEIFRYAYMVLSFACATGFVATLLVRWDLLRRGERILRLALVGEHLTIIYGGYIALSQSYPASVVGLVLTLWMGGIVAGFLLWFYDDLLPGSRAFGRLHP